MKRLVLAVSALLVGATVGLAEKPVSGKQPFAVNFNKLSAYLQLTPAQMEEVEHINEFFLEKQSESLRARVKWQDRKMQEAVYGNLKLMKKALTADQYRKYVILLNVTHNNNRRMGMNSLPDVYLADHDVPTFFVNE